MLLCRIYAEPTPIKGFMLFRWCLRLSANKPKNHWSVLVFKWHVLSFFQLFCLLAHCKTMATETEQILMKLELIDNESSLFFTLNAWCT